MDLLKTVGINSAPKTWDEFFADGEKLKAKGTAALAMMTADDAWHTMNAFSYIAAGAGGADSFAPIFVVGYALRSFEYPFIMTSGGPANSSHPVALHLPTDDHGSPVRTRDGRRFGYDPDRRRLRRGCLLGAPEG
jgi:hypothetical protein